MTEVWKDIQGYEGSYQVSSLGRVRSLGIEKSFINQYGSITRYTTKEKILKTSIMKNGYEIIGLGRKSDRKMHLIHRLVAEAFIPNPDNLPQVNHKDENPLNNCVTNLEYVTSEANCNYGKHNKNIKDSLTNNDKISQRIVQKSLDGIVLNIYPSVREASRITGYNNGNISRCARGIYKSAGGYKWEYV